jgi:site-specific DNA-methyltransferase (adenine-specific)/adenine-specific DNA-methyltransferase
MNYKINKNDVEFLIDCLKSGKEIPEAFKYELFPTKQKEYELVYAGKARKEDILADNEEAKAVPLQIEKIFNGLKYPFAAKNWHNLLVFGDNLQILKTFYRNEDPLIKGKVKGKVKLIYIDPPFATDNDFKTTGGQNAYSDKRRGADFVEFLRRRLILARSLLAEDGTIYVHVDFRKGHYIKVILDEIFAGFEFAEIVWFCGLMGSGKYFPKAHEVIYCYKSLSANFNSPSRLGLSQRITKALQKDKKGWFYTRGRESSGGMNYLKSYVSNDSFLTKEEAIAFANKNRLQPAWSVWIGKEEIATVCNDYPVGTYAYTPQDSWGYPTQKPELLLRRIIEASSETGDLVMDFFCGSGTTLVAAEKLGRRWIGCDVGKLAIYTIQKRLLSIEESKDLENPKNKYDKSAKSFVVATSGLYDLGKIFALEQEKYVCFVKDLFEIEETKREKIGGVEIDGMKRGFPVKIFPYWKMQKTSVDEEYLEALHKNLGRKVGERFYIIAPANNVDFISDYHEIDDTKYYFLKVPYQIIKELHKVPFKKLHQPQSKSQINNLEESKGFHFVRPPEVEAKIKVSKDKIMLTIKKFETAYTQDETGEKLKDFESLAMLLVDLNYDGDKFMMTHYFFAEDLLNHKKKDEGEESVEEIKRELKQKKEITREFPKKECGKQMMAIYVDIYGNEFRDVFNLK